MAEWWSADLLDSQDRKIATLPRVTGGSLDWSIFRDVQGQGSLDITEEPIVGLVGGDGELYPSDWLFPSDDLFPGGSDSGAPNWLSDRIKLWHHLDGRAPEPQGIWLVTRPSRRHEGGVARSTLTLVDKTQLLNQPVGAWLTYPAGTVVTSTVLGIIYSRGETRANIEPSTETLRSAVTFEPKDTWLTVAGTLLRAIGHEDLYASLDGILSSAPYVDPADRPVVAAYGAGLDKMLPTWDDEADISSIPNVVQIIATGTETEPGLIGTASNDNPDDPLSTANRPEIAHQEDVDEGTSQTAVDTIAAKRLAELQSVVRRATITHPMDDTRINQVVRHDPAAYAGAIVQRTVRLDIGPCVTDTVRRVYTGGELPW